LTWGRRTEEGEEIDQEVGSEFDGARSMINSLFGIIAHDERVGRQGLGAILARYLQARHPCEQELVVVHDEHLVVLIHNPLRDLSRSHLSRRSVGNGCKDGKRVCQFGLPNGVKSVMRRSLRTKSPHLIPTYLGSSNWQTCEREYTCLKLRASPSRLSRVRAPSRAPP